MADDKRYELREKIKLTDKAETAGIVLKTINTETRDNSETTEIDLDENNTTQTSETQTGNDSDVEGIEEGNCNAVCVSATPTTRETVTAVTRPRPPAQHTAAAGNSNGLTTDMFQQLMQCMQQNMENLNQKLEVNLNEMKQSQNEMKQNLNEMKQNLNGMKQEIRQDIHRIEENYRELKDTLKSDIKECQTILGNQINYLYDTQEHFKTEIEHVKVTQQKHSSELKLFTETFDEQIQKCEHNMKETLIVKLKESDRSLEDMMRVADEKLYHTLSEKIHQNQKDTEEQRSDVAQIKETITAHKSELDNLKINVQSNYNNSPPQIFCTGNSSAIPEMTLPKFNGRTQNPRDFLAKFHRYYERSLKRPHLAQVDACEHLMDLIENSLESHAARWFSMVKSEVIDWDSFASVFERKYWSRDVQRGIRQRLEIDKYRPTGNLTRAEYFIEKVITLRSLTPPMMEDEIVICLSEHFDGLIQDARRVQNLNTVQEFEALLQREDVKDSHRKSQLHQRSEPRRLESPPQRPERQNNYFPRPLTNQSQRPYEPPRQYTDSRTYPSRPSHLLERPNSSRFFNSRQNNRPRYNGNNDHPRTNSPPHDHQRENPRRDARDQNGRYPTPEQNRTCHMLVNRSPPQLSTPTAPTEGTLNG